MRTIIIIVRIYARCNERAPKRGGARKSILNQETSGEEEY